MPGIPQNLLDALASGKRNTLGSEKGEPGWRSAAGFDVKPLVAALKANPDVTHLHLQNLNINSDGLIELAHALRGNRALKAIDLSGNGMTDDSAAAFAAVLKSLPSLQKFSIENSAMLTDTGTSTLAHALSLCPDLRAINFSENRIGLSGAAAIGQLMKRCHRLEDVYLNYCGISANPSSSKHIAEAIPHCPNLGRLMANDAMGVPKYSVFDTCEGKVTPQTNPNLHQTGPKTPYIDAVIKQNYDNAADRFAPIQAADGGIESFRTRDIAAIAGRVPIMMSLAETYYMSQRHGYNVAINREKAASLRDYLENPPALDLPTLTRDDLIRPGEHGLTPLDHPSTWQSFGEIVAALEKKGTPINSAFLAQKNSRGETWLECGMASAPEAVITTLNARGIRLQADQLLQPGAPGKPALPGALLEIAIANDAVPLLFTRDNWLGAAPSTLRRVYNALPFAEREKIPGDIDWLSLQISGTARSGSIGR